MKFRPLRAAGALTVLTLAAALAGPGISQAATTPSNAADFGIRLLQAPVSEKGDPRASVYVIDQLKPGAVIHRKFQVTDLGSKPVTLHLYPAAASVSGGTFQFASGHTQNDMTTWVHLSQGSVKLAAHQSATLTASVDVPRDASAGEQYGVIWAEEDGTGSGNIALVSRVGIRMYLDIGAGGAAPAAFTLGQPTTAKGSASTRLIQVPVHNTGGRAVDVSGTMQLTGGPGGLQAGPFNTARMVTIAPGQTYPATFAVSSKLPDGPWQASFTLKSDLITKTEKVTLNLAASSATTATSHKTFPIAPVAGGIGLFLILVIGAMLIARHRRSPGARHA